VYALFKIKKQKLKIKNGRSGERREESRGKSNVDLVLNFLGGGKSACRMATWCIYF